MNGAERAFAEHGFAVVRNVVSRDEVSVMREEIEKMIAGAPVDRSTSTDRDGNPVDHPQDFSYGQGRNGSPVLNRISNQLARSCVMREVYANPKLLSLVEDIYGPEFVPFAESIVIKMPENGSSFANHQDGQRFDLQDRGLNVGIYLQPSTEQNGCLRVVPGSQRNGKVDVDAIVARDGSILSDSLPVEAEAGDVVIHDRSVIHGSLPNESPDLRVTVYFGFHRLDSIEAIHDDGHIRRRAQAIGLCIHERQASGRYETETSFDYALSKLAPVPETDDEIETVLRTPALKV